MTVRPLIAFFGSLALAAFGVSHLAAAQGIGGYGGGFGGGFGGYGGGFGGGFSRGGLGAGGQGTVTVKYGEVIYDAVFGDLIDYNVFYIQVPPDAIGVHYFDDGSNGDEIAFDGIPSNITSNRDTFLGPFSIRYKKQLQNAVQVTQNMGALQFFDMPVVAESEESTLPNVVEARNQLSSMVDELRAHLAQFEGYNDQKYVKSVDPTLIESLEGAGGSAFFGGPGTQLPNLPPPPGVPQFDVRGQQVNEGAEGAAGAGTQPPETGGGFSPIGRAQQAVGALEAQNSISGP